MTIGSHSKSHAFLTNETQQHVWEEVLTSRVELERRLGTQVTCFAYPGGGFNPSVVRAVAKAGYRLAFTVCRHQDPQYPLLTIPRTGLWQQSCLSPFGKFSPEIMSCQAAGTFYWPLNCGKHAHTETSNGDLREGVMNQSV
jgi:peptidoglycan/xylan/chitin deacetylase (PgdA/CDA1 family)